MYVQKNGLYLKVILKHFLAKPFSEKSLCICTHIQTPVKESRRSKEISQASGSTAEQLFCFRMRKQMGSPHWKPDERFTQHSEEEKSPSRLSVLKSWPYRMGRSHRRSRASGERESTKQHQ